LKQEFSENDSYNVLRNLLSTKYVTLSKQKLSRHRQVVLEKYLQVIVSSKDLFNSHTVQAFLELLTDNTLALPDEMLLHIFKFVPRNVLLGMCFAISPTQHTPLHHILSLSLSLSDFVSSFSGLVCRRWLKIVSDKQYKQLLGDLPAIARSEFINARSARKSVYISPNQNPKVRILYQNLAQMITNTFLTNLFSSQFF
jgi:hypothetical protein